MDFWLLLPNEIINLIAPYIKPEYIGLALLSIRPLADFFRPAAGLDAGADTKFRDDYIAYQQRCAWPASKGRETDATHFLGRLHGEITELRKLELRKLGYEGIKRPTKTIYSFGKEISTTVFYSEFYSEDYTKVKMFTNATKKYFFRYDGTVEEEQPIKDGKIHGKVIRYTKRMKVKETIEYHNGIQHGQQIEYYVYEKMNTTARFIFGVEEGFRIGKRNEKIIVIYPIKNGIATGIATIFHENHNLVGREISIHIMRALGCCPVMPGIEEEIPFVNGLANGIIRCYNHYGNLRETITYVDGRQI